MKTRTRSYLRRLTSDKDYLEVSAPSLPQVMKMATEKIEKLRAPILGEYLLENIQVTIPNDLVVNKNLSIADTPGMNAKSIKEEGAFDETLRSSDHVVVVANWERAITNDTLKAIAAYALLKQSHGNVAVCLTGIDTYAVAQDIESIKEDLERSEKKEILEKILITQNDIKQLNDARQESKSNQRIGYFMKLIGKHERYLQHLTQVSRRELVVAFTEKLKYNIRALFEHMDNANIPIFVVSSTDYLAGINGYRWQTMPLLLPQETGIPELRHWLRSAGSEAKYVALKEHHSIKIGRFMLSARSLAEDHERRDVGELDALLAHTVRMIQEFSDAACEILQKDCITIDTAGRLLPNKDTEQEAFQLATENGNNSIVQALQESKQQIRSINTLRAVLRSGGHWIRRRPASSGDFEMNVIAYFNDAILGMMNEDWSTSRDSPLAVTHTSAISHITRLQQDMEQASMKFNNSLGCRASFEEAWKLVLKDICRVLAIFFKSLTAVPKIIVHHMTVTKAGPSLVESLVSQTLRHYSAGHIILETFHDIRKKIAGPMEDMSLYYTVCHMADTQYTLVLEEYIEGLRKHIASQIDHIQHNMARAASREQVLDEASKASRRKIKECLPILENLDSKIKTEIGKGAKVHHGEEV